MTESVMITATIDAHEKRDVMTSDVPNAFVQTGVPPEKKKPGNRIVMKIKGHMVDLLLEIDRKLYAPFVVHDNKGKKILYVVMDKALYGMIQSSLLYYNKFVKDITKIGFKLNPYDPCVANRMVNGKQHTITWHVDDIKSSHVDPKVNDEFHDWLQQTYGDVAKVKSTRGKVHDYLGMILDYQIDGKVGIDMVYYVNALWKAFNEIDPITNSQYPWDTTLFKVDEKSPLLSKQRADQFITFVYQALFVSKTESKARHCPSSSILDNSCKGPNQRRLGQAEEDDEILKEYSRRCGIPGS